MLMPEPSRSSANSACSRNSAAATFPRARSSLAICWAPRSFSKNSRFISFARRSDSGVRFAFPMIASIISGFRMRSCWLKETSSRRAPFWVAAANSAIAAGGVFEFVMMASWTDAGSCSWPAKYAKTLGATSAERIADSSASVCWDRSVASEFSFNSVSSPSKKLTSISSRSDCGKGKMPRDAASRAGRGAVPSITALTTGLLEIISELIRPGRELLRLRIF